MIFFAFSFCLDSKRNTWSKTTRRFSGKTVCIYANVEDNFNQDEIMIETMTFAESLIQEKSDFFASKFSAQRVETGGVWLPECEANR